MIVAQVIVAIAYAALAWLDRATPPGSAAGGSKALRTILGVVVIVHGAILWRLMFRAEGVNLSFAVSLSLIGFLLALWSAVSGSLMPVPGMARRTLPLVAVASMLPALLPAPHWLSYSSDFLAAAHLVVALLAFSMLVVAAVQAAAMLALQQDLRQGLPAATATMPPVLTLERWLFGLIGVGFVLLTATLISGAFFSESLFGKPFQFTHKTLFTTLAWLLFGVLLAGRWRFGWRGRQALRWVVIGSLLLLIGYAGSKFVLEVLLGRR